MRLIASELRTGDILIVQGGEWEYLEPGDNSTRDAAHLVLRQVGKETFTAAWVGRSDRFEVRRPN